MSGHPVRRRKQPPHEAKTTWSPDIKPLAGGDVESLPTHHIAFSTPHASRYSLVLGLGERYGSAGKSGMSPTEEEFQTARDCGLPILWFVMKCNRDAPQQAFYERIANYEEGYFVSFFSSTVDLVTKITKAVNEFLNKSATNVLDKQEASKLTTHYVSQMKSAVSRETFLGTVIFPCNQTEPYINAPDLGNSGVTERFLQPALFGSTAIFRPQFGTKSGDGREHLSFVQSDRNESLLSSLEVHLDGALVWLSSLRPEHDSDYSVVRAYVVDEERVREKLHAFLSYGDLFYSTLIDTRHTFAFYLTVAVWNLQGKKLGRIGAKAQDSISIGFNSMEDPLVVPSKPMKVSRSQLKDAGNLTHNILELVIRAFKSEDLYYSE